MWRCKYRSAGGIRSHRRKPQTNIRSGRNSSITFLKGIARYEAVKQEVIYGATTWSAVGKCLKQISSQLHRDGSHDVESRIVDDFLQDLGARELLA
jgi:hypothetical protein